VSRIGRKSVAVGFAGTLFAAVYVVIVLLGNGWDITIFLAEGEEAPIQAEYAESVLGLPIATRPSFGHDGKFFFAQANDPWYQNPETHAAVLDLPVYRAQRMLYPTLAGGLGLFSPRLVVWTMVLVNVVGVGVGSAITSALAMNLGRSRWVGLAFALNPGVIADLDINGSGVLALALAIGGALLMLRRHVAWASVAFTCAVLARETMILFVIGALLGIWFSRRRRELAPLLVSVAAALVWRIYITNRLAGLGLETLGGLPENPVGNLNWRPLAGALDAIPYWLDNPAKFALVGALVLLIILFIRRSIGDRTVVSWSALPFVVLSLFLSVFVWREPYDLARAVAPVFTAYPLLLVQNSARPQEHVFD
jgi:hypothetical protein